MTDFIDQIIDAVNKNAAYVGECGCRGPQNGDEFCPCKMRIIAAKKIQREAVEKIIVHAFTQVVKNIVNKSGEEK